MYPHLFDHRLVASERIRRPGAGRPLEDRQRNAERPVSVSQSVLQSLMRVFSACGRRCSAPRQRWSSSTRASSEAGPGPPDQAQNAPPGLSEEGRAIWSRSHSGHSVDLGTLFLLVAADGIANDGGKRGLWPGPARATTWRLRQLVKEDPRRRAPRRRAADSLGRVCRPARAGYR